MRIHYSKILPLLLLLQMLSALAAEIPPSAIKWPTAAEALIDQAISIKMDAQRQNMTMRTKDGASGFAFAKCMDDLFLALQNKGIESVLLRAEGSDLKAKMSLWALDRARRPEKYAQIAERHVNVSNWHLGRRGSPQLVAPLPVGVEDAIEANRWIFEYFYFAPPTGSEFVRGTGRYVLGDAIAKIGNEKSLNLLKFDIEAQIASFPEAMPGQGSGFMIGGDAPQLLDFKDPRAFKVAALFLQNPGVRKHFSNFGVPPKVDPLLMRVGGVVSGC